MCIIQIETNLSHIEYCEVQYYRPTCFLSYSCDGFTVKAHPLLFHSQAQNFQKTALGLYIIYSYARLHKNIKPSYHCFQYKHSQFPVAYINRLEQIKILMKDVPYYVTHFLCSQYFSGGCSGNWRELPYKCID